MARHHYTIFRNNFGFTIVEVLLVIGLIGTVLAFSAPSVKKLINSQQKNIFNCDAAQLRNAFINKQDEMFYLNETVIHDEIKYTKYFPFYQITNNSNKVSKNDDINYTVLCELVIGDILKTVPGFENRTYKYERATDFENKGRGNGKITYFIENKGTIDFYTIVIDRYDGDRLMIDYFVYTSKNYSKKNNLQQRYSF